MAYNSSGNISPNETYTLGQYTFTMDCQYDSATNDTLLTATCSIGEETSTKQKTIVGEATLSYWHVEVSDNAADVYAYLDPKKSQYEELRIQCLSIESVYNPKTNGWHAGTFDDLSSGSYRVDDRGRIYAHVSKTLAGDKITAISDGNKILFASESTCIYGGYGFDPDVTEQGDHAINISWWSLYHYTYKNKADGRIVYYRTVDWTSEYTVPISETPIDTRKLGETAWELIYNASPILDNPDVFVGRFQIVPEDADPEDWDDPIDDGDPAYTLKVTIRGALSGRHNDPMLLTPHSYIPADNLTVKDYGCGGDGGYGGGGGAGASTVIVYRYSTSKAGSHETYAYARRHGYGSGGGKGGKGGDGCIIVYW